ncbi:MAG: FIST N-terminal domain-containing protein [Candidatus Nanopelagicales bacterium]
MHVSAHRWRRGAWDVVPDGSVSGPRTLVLIFAASGFWEDRGVLDEVRAMFSDSVVLGCSTAGEILGTTIEDGSVTVAVVTFQGTDLRAASAVMPGIADSFTAGASIAQQLQGDDLRAVLLLSPGLDVNGSELVRGINSGLAADVLVAGGLAGDGARFVRTWAMDADGPGERLVAAVGFYGNRVRVGHGARGGWSIFGPERVITRSEGSTLYELDGEPALALYKDYLGELAAGLPAAALRFPLALRESADSDKHLVRTILAVDEEQQSMTFAGDLPQGWMAQLMRANFDELVAGAEDAAEMADAGVSHDGLAIAISCVGRRLMLGEAAEEEVEATVERLPDGSTQVGFYSYGELAPFASGSCDLHNQTMTLLVIGEELASV